MNGKCIFRGKKGIVAVLIALVLFACKNIDDDGEIQPPAPEQSAGGTNQGGEQNPGQSENPGEIGNQSGGNKGDEQTPDEAENPGDGENLGGEEENPEEGQNPQNPPTTKAVSDLLKEIIEEAEYEAISAKVATGNLTLTAETIKALGDLFPALEKDAESGKEAKDLENAAAILQNKEAFVAQAEGEMSVRFGPIYSDWYEEYPFLFDEETDEKKYVVTYKANVKFTGEFNLSEISLPDNNGKGNFTNATLTNNGEEITIDKVNEIRGTSLPTLNLNISLSEDFINGTEVYNLYKAYSKDVKDLDKVLLKGDLSANQINGKTMSNNPDKYTLFTDDDKAKSSKDDSIKSLDVNALAKMSNQLKVYIINNLIVSGTPTQEYTVDWKLGNVVFEEDMDKIKNTATSPLNGSTLSLYGIVYFKGRPYNNNGNKFNQGVLGMLKLDNLENVSYDNFGISFSGGRFGVLDVRGVTKNFMDNYNVSDEVINKTGGDIHAIYFSNYYNSYKGDKDKIEELCYKFSNPARQGVHNVYLGDDKVYGVNYYEEDYQATSRRPRTLKEFEALGNSDYGDYMHFDKSAKSSYTDEEFDALPKKEQKSLTDDANGDTELLIPNQLAKIKLKQNFSSATKYFG